MVFCNKTLGITNESGRKGHNPYFNRWFSAILNCTLDDLDTQKCHNPYFNRWFSAIDTLGNQKELFIKSQSLF